MPRIDPSQLLNTLSVLLAPNGGIKSAGEVQRIVQLMQKFSKKLVSKCIYIHILCASTPDLLELFLQQKGWDLLNAWFTDAYTNQNYYLCGDLVKLFAVCPMTSTRLKENVEINQAPKLIRQLSTDEKIEADVRTAALQVLQKWMSVIRSPPVNGNSPSVPAKTGTKRPLFSKYDEKDFVTGGSDESENEAQLDFDDSKDYNPNEDSDDERNRKKLKPDDSTDVDDLLVSTETSEDDDDDDALTKFYKKRSEKKQKEEERKKEKEKRKLDEKRSKAYSKTEIRDKLDSSGKEKIKETVKKLREEQEEKKSTLISSLGRIPKIPKPDSEKKVSNGPSFGDLLGGLDNVKPKPKAAPIKNKTKDLLQSFTDQSPNKPKSRSEKDKEKVKSSSEKEKHRSDRDKERSRDKDKDRERHKSRDKDKEKDKERDKDKHRDKDKEKHRDKERSRDKEHRRERKDSVSKSSDESKSEKSDSDRPKPKLNIPEKRSHKESSLPSPKEEVKKSPKVIKESNFLGDILGDIMKEPPKKKKRRPSDVKVTENNLKELAEKAEKAKSEEAKEKSPEKTDSKENSPPKDDEPVNSNDLEFSEPTKPLTRDVRGILVYVKGNKPKKRISWREERDLVAIEYFELDEDERCNVYKEKSFEEMKKREAMFEKSKLSTGFNESDDSKLWKLIPIDFDGENVEVQDRLKKVYGSSSKEKTVQEEREGRVLKALLFNQSPKDPSEPDPGSNDKLGVVTQEIPIDDSSDNKDESTFSHMVWPQPSGYSAPVSQNPTIPTNLNALLSNIGNIPSNLLSSLPPTPANGNKNPSGPPDLSRPPPSMMSAEEAQLLAAQKAAAAALAAPQGYPSNGNNHYNNHNNGYNDRGHGGHRGHHNRHYNDRGYNKGYNNHNNQYNRDRYSNRDSGSRKPCKFWMDRGYCKEEDRCYYAHPSR